MTVVRFALLSDEQLAWISNGCGPSFLSSLVPDLLFRRACDRHDFDYWSGFAEDDRYRADIRFLVRMQEAADEAAGTGWWARLRRRFYRSIALRYYYGVRWFGKGAFSYRKRYGSYEDLEREMTVDLAS